jgi:hypothetical protein
MPGFVGNRGLLKRLVMFLCTSILERARWGRDLHDGVTSG